MEIIRNENKIKPKSSRNTQVLSDDHSNSEKKNMPSEENQKIQRQRNPRNVISNSNEENINEEIKNEEEEGQIAFRRLPNNCSEFPDRFEPEVNNF